ncbi:Dynamin family protein [Pyrenochaeta sp. DS3sAY3a]|nr:Dynamin family protein [Pyrenochaeta sp. DS3sAY3a]
MADTPEDWVALGPSNVKGMACLRTESSSKRLNQIDQLRAKGVSDHIALPQIVVCGDQSVGKSSVLEGITGIPFPRQEGVCTKFATEIILRHQPGETRMVAKVLASASRTKEERLRMAAFERKLTTFDDLPTVIQEASALMGIGDNCSDSDSNSTCTTFAADVLRLEVVGDTGLHLTIVDLPGLISVSDNPDDLNIVDNLVDGYLESSRTIILAVVPAAADIETQRIIQRARKFDSAGERTVGIITKPDLINKGTEARVAKLAKNIDKIKLKLGFFLLKNPSPDELRESLSLAERHRKELDFFQSSPWKEQNLDKMRTGASILRSFLQELLDSHIERELPKVRAEVKSLLLKIASELGQIGPERSTVSQTRSFLTQKSMEFFTLTESAVDGNYAGRDAPFFEVTASSASNRLRAKVHQLNEHFSTRMREKAAKREIASSDKDITEDAEDSTKDGPIMLSKVDMIKWVEKAYENTRGRELPGNYNHALLSELFHEQSSRWGDIARKHVSTTSVLVTQFVQAVLAHIVADKQVRGGMHSRTQQSLSKMFQRANEELEKILLDERIHPITYNHYYIDNIQKARADAEKVIFQKIVNDARFGNRIDVETLTSSMQTRIVVNMTEQACLETLAALDAYYKVAMKTFVDNVCRQVVERHLITGLSKVFDPVYLRLSACTIVGMS